MDEQHSQPVADQAPVYVGFWRRIVAQVIDLILWCAIAYPVLLTAYGMDYFSDAPSTVAAFFGRGPIDYLMSWVFPIIGTIAFWRVRQATPGKMFIRARIVDSRTGGRPSLAQCVGRYFAVFVSILPLFLGVLWIALDRRKQGWHDKLAGTAVQYVSAP